MCSHGYKFRVIHECSCPKCGADLEYAEYAENSLSVSPTRVEFCPKCEYELIYN